MSLKQKFKKIVLIDGSSYLYRAYHALPPLTNSKGQPTGAIYGVVNMLNKLIKEEEPDYIGVIFDTQGKTFRHDLYPDYKAHRPPMENELRSQIQPLQDVIKAMGLPLIAVVGVEADDVIGTLVARAKDQGLHTLISTGDKDFAQLVNHEVHLVNTMTGVRLDEAGVCEKFGVPPHRITDYLALVGDSVDNVPGVPKVGPKTAVKWLTEYGSLENIIKQADSFKGKIGENLRASLAYLPLAHQLVSIQHDIPLEIELEGLKATSPDNQRLHDLFLELEFKNWLKNIKLSNITLERENKTQHYASILIHTDLDNLLIILNNASMISFAIETMVLNRWDTKIIGLSFAVKPGQAYYIPLGHDYEGAPTQLNATWVLATLKSIFENPKIKKIAHDIKYHLGVLWHYDIHPAGLMYDTMLESYVYNATAARHTLDNLASLYLEQTPITFEEVIGKGVKKIGFNQVDIASATAYVAQNADIVLRLHQILWPQLEAIPTLLNVYEAIEVPLIWILATMERTGVKIDAQQLNAQSQSLQKRVSELESQVYVLAGEIFNLGSPKQLQEILYTKLQIPIVSKTPTGQPSTSEEVLQMLSVTYELPALILEYRSLSKLKATYTDKLPLLIHEDTGRIHTSYHQAVTATGRLSSTDPNLQNIPIRTLEGRKIRKAFIPESNFVIMAADYSQVELRIMAHLSQDASLIDAFKLGQDIHQVTASEILQIPLEEVTFEQRRSAKAINFGLIYGMSAFGLARELGTDRKQAEQYIQMYFQRYPGVQAYMDNTKILAAQQGFVETFFGRRLYFPDIFAKNIGKKRAAERTAINAPLQGTAADIIKLAMIQLQGWIDKEKVNHKIKMIMQVHDELVFEVVTDFIEEAKEAIKHAMENTVILCTPLLVSIGVGESWDTAH